MAREEGQGDEKRVDGKGKGREGEGGEGGRPNSMSEADRRRFLLVVFAYFKCQPRFRLRTFRS